MSKLRLIIADDERPAREFLKSIIAQFDDVEVIGEAETGVEAVELIKAQKPDLALLDLQMPEAGGLDVVRLLRRNQMPFFAFVTAYDEYAIKAFELNAVDYLLKPVDKKRLRETLDRVLERIEHQETVEAEKEKAKNAAEVYEDSINTGFLQRLPLKKNEEIYLVRVENVVSISADGELLHIRTDNGDKYLINYRLKDLEIKLDPSKFVRLSRSAIVNIDKVTNISPMPGGTYLITLQDRQQYPVSRIQSRILRDRLLKI